MSEPIPAEGATSQTETLAFSVDTHLLRELGALLVGRDSTALTELVKNAYDADATVVVIHGERLGANGLISVRDDGHGMTYSDFSTKFLRIAGRSKEGGARRSPIYRRKYTGAKGIGRLSSHKLGEVLSLESNPDLEVLERVPTDRGFAARIDWSALEQNDNSMDEARDISARKDSGATMYATPGTVLTISRLHSAWSPRKLNEFLSEVRSTRPDPIFFEPLAERHFLGDSLLPFIEPSDSSDTDPGFRVELSGDFAGSDAQWPTLMSHVQWQIEIDALDQEQITYRIRPARSVREKYGDVEAREFNWQRRAGGARFAARIFVRDGSGGGGNRLPDILDRFAKQASGIRVFYEGFRVLPYGTPRNDWLGLDRAYSRRGSLDFVDDLLERDSRNPHDERTYQLPNSSHFGAVFIHDETSGGLQMVVNREGFLPTEQFDDLTESIQRGLNLSTRLRASYGARYKAEADAQKRSETQTRLLSAIEYKSDTTTRLPSTSRLSAGQQLEKLIEAGTDAAQRIKVRGPDSDTRMQLEVVRAALAAAESATEAVMQEQSQLRVLSSLGTQVGAFVHEVNGLLAQARQTRDLLDQFIEEQGAKHGFALRLRNIRASQNELVAGLERQAVYLADSLGAEARKRRVRQRVSERWATAMRLLGSSAERRGVIVDDRLNSSLMTLPMFPSELNVILTNLLSNAIKGTIANPTSRRRIIVSGHQDVRGTHIRIENTGDRVDLADSERWFRPFETTTGELDSALGQGLGLGLSLTRRLVEEYGGEIAFVAPSPDMSTAIEVVLPNR